MNTGSYSFNSIYNPSNYNTNSLSDKVRDTINRQRQRMANLELTLGKTASEKIQLENNLKKFQKDILHAEYANIQLENKLADKRQRILDLEAQLEVYRRQAIADRAEINNLKEKAL